MTVPVSRLICFSLPLLLLAFTTAAFAQPCPNLYRSVEGWASLPDGRTWGAGSDLDVDPDGNMYGGEPGPRRLQKYVRARP